MRKTNDQTSQVENFKLSKYVAPEHKTLLENAEANLKEYEEYLFSKIKNDLFECGWTMQPDPEEIRKAEQLFLNNPMGLHLIKHLAGIKGLVERPRFTIDAT